MSFVGILKQHKALNDRRAVSESKLAEVQSAFRKEHVFFHNKDVAVFCAGSLGRSDFGSRSDLDLFAISQKADADRRRLEDLEILAKLIEVNRGLNYPEFSNDGRYLKVYSIHDMKSALGQARDDGENLFTARMLLLLESKPIFGDALYERQLLELIEHYFRDFGPQKRFRPIFLLNDILRYWRTLCLNYEKIRNEPDKPWWKKNVNLKFSRMLTIFGTVLPMIAGRMSSVAQISSLMGKSPIERFAIGLDAIDDETLESKFLEFLDLYETFLRWKEEKDGDSDIAIKEESRQAATYFSEFVYTALHHKNIDAELRRYLVL